MDFELLTEEKIKHWLQCLRRQIGRYARTVLSAMRSPSMFVSQAMANRFKRNNKKYVAPIPFVLLTLVLGSLLDRIVVGTFGFEHPMKSYELWLMSLQKFLFPMFYIRTVLHSLSFFVVLLVIAFLVKVLDACKRSYWAYIGALSYLLPFCLIANTISDCMKGLVIIMSDLPRLWSFSACLLISILFSIILYSLIFKVIDYAYFTGGWRRNIHMLGYVMAVPVLLCILDVLIYGIVPMGFQLIHVIGPTAQGQSKLTVGDYAAAEKLFIQAINNDPSGELTTDARILLISANSRRILANLPMILSDSGMRKRLIGHFAQSDPFRRLQNLWLSDNLDYVTPLQFVDLRDAILDSFLAPGVIPVTDSELDCALRPTAVDENCDELPKEAVTGFGNTPVQRQRLFYHIFRSRALKGEPTQALMPESTTVGTKRYLQFLGELIIRIEFLFVRYHARNLMRESETLAYLDSMDRYGYFNRDNIIEGNRKIMKHGYKYPHLMLPEAEIKKLSDRELGFCIRHTYINYLQAETRLLKASTVCDESRIIEQQAASIEEQLNWILNDAMYRDVPPVDRIVQKIFNLIGLESLFMNTIKGQDREVNH